MTPERRPFNTVLVANRGEIALRVMRTAKALGYRTVAVYSEADADALHVAYADEAVLIGPAPAAESYLRAAAILDAARTSAAEAIHPGYGFLSENAEFAHECQQAGLIFIGPSPGAIELMGDKATAKRHMIEAGVPCVPGYEGEDQSLANFLRAADEIGFPIMVKATAGGGGRGMRLVNDRSELEQALPLARSEAENAFGNGDLILEKALVRPRHVEIQVFGDQHGNVIHLGERDCSVQRRHQKVIEEAPCPAVTAQLRAAMGTAAVKAAASVNYVGAGTVEFLLDQDGSFYFLEMNTRLQVEHPVTELITGLDLVTLQLQVAAGEPLAISQNEVILNGHAIEVRLYAEDPANDFLPATGNIALWHPPAGAGIRVDEGIATGLEVSPFYDPLLAKIIAWGESRDVARQRLIKALNQTALFGPASNRDFLIAALQRPAFADGAATTAFIAESFDAKPSYLLPPGPAALAAAAVLQFTAARQAAQTAAISMPDELLNFTNAAPLVTPFDYSTDATSALVTVTPTGGNSYLARVNSYPVVVHANRVDAPAASVSIDGEAYSILFRIMDAGVIHLGIHGQAFTFFDRTAVARQREQAAGDGAVLAVMHGMLIAVLVEPGSIVRRGDTVAIVEAMKMQHEVKAEIDGAVTSIDATPGLQIGAGDLIMEIAPAES